jgi:putative ABC transport system permease protein
MFIIYNSFAIAVTQRRSEIGILRALGATRRQIRWLFLSESAVTGLVGSLGGLALGVLIARGIAASIGALISDVYVVAQHADELSTSPWVLAGALAIGVSTSIIAALIPAQNAARIDPVRALQKGKYQVLSAGESRVRVTLAAVLGAVSIACLIAGGSRPVFYAGYALAIAAALLLSPLLSLALAKALRRSWKALRPVGRAGGRQPDQAPRRTGERRRADAVSGAGGRVVGMAGRATVPSSTG